MVGTHGRIRSHRKSRSPLSARQGHYLIGAKTDAPATAQVRDNAITAAQLAARLSNAHRITHALKLDLGTGQKAKRFPKFDGNRDLAFGADPHLV
jgi:hypothetical protein